MWATHHELAALGAEELAYAKAVDHAADVCAVGMEGAGFGATAEALSAMNRREQDNERYGNAASGCTNQWSGRS